MASSVSSGSYFTAWKNRAQGNFHLMLHVGFHCLDWILFTCRASLPRILGLLQKRLLKWQPSMFCLFCCQCFSHVVYSMKFTYTLSGTCRWYKEINVISHQKQQCLYFISLAHTYAGRVINPIRLKRAHAHPWKKKAQSWQCYTFWLQLCICLYRHVHSVFLWCHCLQDSWSYKLILSAYLCDRNVEALLWLNRSFTILFISLPPREKCFLHFTVWTSAFTTGSSLPLSSLQSLSPYLEHSTCIHFSLMCRKHKLQSFPELIDVLLKSSACIRK